MEKPSMRQPSVSKNDSSSVARFDHVCIDDVERSLSQSYMSKMEAAVDRVFKGTGSLVKFATRTWHVLTFVQRRNYSRRAVGKNT